LPRETAYFWKKRKSIPCKIPEKWPLEQPPFLPDFSTHLKVDYGEMRLEQPPKNEIAPKIFVFEVVGSFVLDQAGGRGIDRGVKRHAEKLPYIYLSIFIK
jgi:hypothetical protein